MIGGHDVVCVLLLRWFVCMRLVESAYITISTCIRSSVPKVRATIIFVLRRGVIFILNGKRYLIIMHPRVRVFVLVLIFIQGCAFTCILKHIVFHLVSANTHTNWHKSAYYDDAVKKRGMSYPLV